MRNMQRRLTKLDGLLPSPPKKIDPIVGQVMVLTFLGIAYHFGDPRPDEEPRIAYARALGYRSLAEWLDAGKDSWERHKPLEQRLFAKFGMSLEDLSEQGTENFVYGLGRIEDSLPESYRAFLAWASRKWPLPTKEGDCEQNSSEI